MSPPDWGFRARIDALHEGWRAAIAAALRSGVAAGNVRPDAGPERAAALDRGRTDGDLGTGRARDAEPMRTASEAVRDYPERLRP